MDPKQKLAKRKCVAKDQDEMTRGWIQVGEICGRICPKRLKAFAFDSLPTAAYIILLFVLSL
jgi:hypothetical protein